MAHFEVSEWSDYVRGVAGAALEGPMREHLSSGCRECRRTVDLLERIVTASRAGALDPAPDDLVRSAKAVIEERRSGLTLPRLTARLVYDSFRAPALAGVRAGAAAVRQTLHRAGDYSIDLRLEGEPGGGQWSLVGQIANHSRPDIGVADVPVFLTGRGRILLFTRSNVFGEFHIEYSYSRNLRLSIPVSSAGRRIELSLDALLADPETPSRGAVE